MWLFFFFQHFPSHTPDLGNPGKKKKSSMRKETNVNSKLVDSINLLLITQIKKPISLQTLTSHQIHIIGKFFF